MREIQWPQVTVSKQYREHAFRKPPSTTMDGGWIKGSFDPWQRSLFVPPVSSANTKVKGPLLAGKKLCRNFFALSWGEAFGGRPKVRGGGLSNGTPPCSPGTKLCDHLWKLGLGLTQGGIVGLNLSCAVRDILKRSVNVLFKANWSLDSVHREFI